MSTIQLPKHFVPNQVTKKTTVSPERTKISTIYETASHENLPKQSKLHIPSKLEHVNPILSLDLLHQYNEIVKAEDKLTFKRLPPVKISYKSSKKFMESPREEGSSRIIRPHLSVNTYSPGHHIFTEGISKSSVIKSPSFALQQVGVPYSNLPDSISIYKEKDKFAFGVKDIDYEKSPYRLTPNQFKIGNATVIPNLSDNSSINSDAPRKLKRGAKSNQGRASLEIRSNIIKLQPLVIRDPTKLEFDTVSIPGRLGPAKPPLVPGNSFLLSDTTDDEEKSALPEEIKLPENKDNTEKIDTGKRKLSVVSIGDTVGPNFYSSQKKEARQLYPMYDLHSMKNENFRKKKFEYLGIRNFQTKPQLPSATFTYKVSTHGMAFIQDTSPDKFKPIRNNLKDSKGNPIHKQRGLVRNPLSASKENTYNKSTDYNFKRYYKKIFHRPKSSDTHSTDHSQLPGNPPPSEISNFFSEDAPMLINDIRNGRLTLIEERSNLSNRKENTPADIGYETMAVPNNVELPLSKLTNLDDTDTCTDTDVMFDNALKVADRYKELESFRSDIGKSSGLDSFRNEIVRPAGIRVNSAQSLKDNDTTKSVCESMVKSESAVVEKYIAEAEQRLKDNLVNDVDFNQAKDQDDIAKLGTIDEVSRKSVNVKLHNKTNQSGNKRLLTVPKLSLDSISQTSDIPIAKERTSLSRKIQNLDIANSVQTQELKPDSNNNNSIDDGNKITLGKSNVKVSVKRLRLFSGTPTSPVPSLTVTVENGQYHEVIEDNSPFTIECKVEYDDSKVVENGNSKGESINGQTILEKRAVNVPFIYPSKSDVKAKRQ